MIGTVRSHLCTPAMIVVSGTGRTWVVLGFVACNYKDHHGTRRDESDITAVELAGLHHELVVDAMRWFSDFATEKHWHSSDAGCQQLQWLIQIWFSAGM